MVTSIFSFSNNVFYLIIDELIIGATFALSSANAFNLDQSRILSFGEELIYFSDGDGKMELAIGYSDRVIRLYKWISEGTEVDTEPKGSLIQIDKWQLAGQVNLTFYYPTKNVRPIQIGDFCLNEKSNLI